MSDNTLNRLKLPHVQSKKISKLSSQPGSSWLGIFSILLFLEIQKKLDRQIPKIIDFDFNSRIVLLLQFEICYAIEMHIASRVVS